MTAKEALRAIVDEMDEEDAERIFPFLSGRNWNTEPERRLSNSELRQLPRALREHIIRAEIAAIPPHERDEMVAGVEEWRYADADALMHIDD